MPIHFNIQHFDSLDSTNKEVLRQAEHGASEGLVIVAETQSDGKGRLGRTWLTIEHALAMSVLLRPNIKPADVPKLSLVTAVAVHEALALFVPQVGIKWPNDLLIDGKKVSGILTEMRGEGGKVNAVVVGMGINVFEPKQGWDASITSPPTSLNNTSTIKVTKSDVLQAVLESLDLWYTRFLEEGFAPVHQAWEAAHIATGKTVSVHDGNTYIQGIALGLANDGALRLLVNGVEQSIIAGDVSISGDKT